jgi:hypothetical protein
VVRGGACGCGPTFSAATCLGGAAGVGGLECGATGGGGVGFTPQLDTDVDPGGKAGGGVGDLHVSQYPCRATTQQASLRAVSTEERATALVNGHGHQSKTGGSGEALSRVGDQTKGRA